MSLGHDGTIPVCDGVTITANGRAQEVNRRLCRQTACASQLAMNLINRWHLLLRWPLQDSLPTGQSEFHTANDNTYCHQNRIYLNFQATCCRVQFPEISLITSQTSVLIKLQSLFADIFPCNTSIVITITIWLVWHLRHLIFSCVKCFPLLFQQLPSCYIRALWHHSGYSVVNVQRPSQARTLLYTVPRSSEDNGYTYRVRTKSP